MSLKIEQHIKDSQPLIEAADRLDQLEIEVGDLYVAAAQEMRKLVAGDQPIETVPLMKVLAPMLDTFRAHLAEYVINKIDPDGYAKVLELMKFALTEEDLTTRHTLH
jgi:hypothetical protein